MLPRAIATGSRISDEHLASLWDIHDIPKVGPWLMQAQTSAAAAAAAAAVVAAHKACVGVWMMQPLHEREPPQLAVTQAAVCRQVAVVNGRAEPGLAVARVAVTC